MSTVGNWRGASIIKQGLVLYLDPGSPNSYYNKSGTTIKDISGNINNGTLTNFGSQTIYNSGSGGSIVFDGTNDFIDCGSNNILIPTNGLTLSIMLKTSVANRFIVDKSNAALTQGYILAGNGAGSYVFYINSTVLTGTKIINDNSWKCITVTWTPGISMVSYINGVIDVTLNTSIPSIITSPSSNFWIGNRRTNTDYFNGLIAISQVYNRALTSQEVLQNFNATKARFSDFWNDGFVWDDNMGWVDNY